MAPSWVPALGFTLVPGLGGFLSSHFIHGEGLHWYASLQKPTWHPPYWTLSPIWCTLYSAMGYGSYLVWKELGGFSEEAVVPLGLYAGQLALNWAWPPIFFGAHEMGWALVDLLLTGGAAAATTVAWYQVSPVAARLLYPYLAWLAFAATLNYCVWRDNRGRRSGRRSPE
ncbi:translocator protein [Loxodonta africana]|uniref:Translocator protein n=1 Tax=Loxodonta africana TaxID=9785 RepID=G3SPL3_LOXAF|nr:translocator protein [Loxodonta africana]XP_010597584.1 translocator protein [Loxodonta africana]XP_010597585.1 translocator protein [Loxodonta africana]XP_049740553.1 translocator protein [Elephas maximus indicus]XP_049740554.1 translocator protein [Elephas maximus indicus]XP_049740555.1 translocator protein [Elephas maximus indicus]XP_049740556.1 translocator protein [Elephas maximus indicus]